MATRTHTNKKDAKLHSAHIATHTNVEPIYTARIQSIADNALSYRNVVYSMAVNDSWHRVGTRYHIHICTDAVECTNAGTQTHTRAIATTTTATVAAAANVC